MLHSKRKQYFIVSETFLPFIAGLLVHEPSEYSDYCLIILTIDTKRNHTHDRKKLDIFETSCFTSHRRNIKSNKDIEQEVRGYFNMSTFLESLS